MDRRLLSCLSCAVTIMAAVVPATAADPRNPNLIESYQQALQHHPELRARQHLLDAERETITQARAAWRPSVEIEGAYGRHGDRIERNRLDDAPVGSDISEPPSVDRDRYAATRGGLRATQTLFDRDRWLARTAAEHATHIADLNWQAARQDLIREVAEQYLGVFEADARVDSLTLERDAIREQYELDLARHAQDVGTLTAVRDARARLLLTEAELLGAHERLDAERARYQRLTGWAIDTVRPLALTDRQSLPTPAEPKALYEQAASKTHGVRIALAEQDAADIALRRARARYGPVVELIASRDQFRNSTNSVTSSSEEARNQIVLQVRMPLYSGGALRSGAREALNRHSAAVEQTRAATIDTEHDIRTAMNGLSTSRQRADVLTEAVTASTNALELRQRAFLAGLTTNREVLDAYQDLYQAERALLSTRLDVLRHYIALRHATGELSVDDLVMIQDEAPESVDADNTSDSSR